MFGIDVSQFQKTIQWDAVKSQIDFAILRLGWIGKAGSHKTDAMFEHNYTECKRLGIPIGIYVYCYSATPENAANGAQWVLEVLKGKSLELPVFLDMEDNSLVGLGRQTLTKICISFGTVIEKGNFRHGVYANANWFRNYLDEAELKRHYVTWIASYTKGTDLYKGEHAMWQNSSTGRLNGISGNVDTNHMYENLIKLNTNHPAGPSGDSGKKESETIYVVKSGDTLDSIAKKFHTTYQELAQKNHIDNPNKIFIGQKITI